MNELNDWVVCAGELVDAGRLGAAVTTVERAASAAMSEVSESVRRTTLREGQRIIRAVKNVRALTDRERLVVMRASRSLLALGLSLPFDAKMRGALWCNCGISEWMAGEIAAAEESLLAAVQLYASAGQVNRSVWALGALVDLMVDLAGSEARAEGYAELLVEQERTTGSPQSIAHALGQLGIVRARRGLRAEAASALEEAIGIRAGLFPGVEDRVVDEWRRTLSCLGPRSS